MPINTETLNRKLYNKLSKYSPKPLDATGKVTPVEDEADVFKFKFTKDGKEYGDVFATVDDERRLILYYGDDVGDSPEAPTPGIGYNDTWLGFVEDLKSWKTRNGFKGWQLKNQDQLAPDMARRNHMKKKDNLEEGYYPMGKKASYSDAIPTIKMVIQHTRQIEEGEQRYRNIAKIFLENQDGERFLAPTTKPGIARVYARHIAEGGKPHDERWNHIGSLCEEYQKMAGFVRATRGQQFNESAQQLVESGIQHYQSLRESLSKLTGHRGYNAYFESWTPPLMEDDSDTSSINELFVQETLDPRIESVMPILSKLHKTVAEMKEVDQLSEWADSLLETEEPEAQDETQSRLEELYDRKFYIESYLDNPEVLEPEELDGMQAELETINDEIEELGGLTEAEGESLTSNNPVAIPEDDEMEEGVVDTLKKVGGKVLDKLGHGSDEELLKDLQKKSGVPAHAQHGKPAMAKTNEEGVAEGLSKQFEIIYYKANGDKARTVISGTSKEAVARQFKKQHKLEIEQVKELSQGVAEDLDANQKRAGQLGPTEKVGKNEKNLRGKLVGANENFINMAPQAVAEEGEVQTFEGQEDLNTIKRLLGK